MRRIDKNRKVDGMSNISIRTKRRRRRIRRRRIRCLCICTIVCIGFLALLWMKRSNTGSSTVIKLGNNWWYIENGCINLKYNGLASNENGWWYIKDGKVDFSHNGIEKNKNGWWYIHNGQVDFSYTGLKKNKNTWWMIENGKVDLNYTGIVENENGQWYVKAGKVDFSYNAMCFQDGCLYDIENGKVEHQTKMVAHRGLSSEAPENTVKSFELAGQAGFWGCETDIYLTKDNQFIISHDDDFKDTCGVKKKPGDMTLEEIKKLKIQKGNNYSLYQGDDSATRIPTLEEYLEVCKQYNMTPFIEIKEHAYSNSDQSKDVAELLYQKVKKVMENRQVVFISMDFTKLQQMREVLDEHNEQNMDLQHIVYTAYTSMIDTYKSLNMNLDSSFTGIPMEDIQTFKANGITVGVWIIADKEKAYDFAKAGVDYITTGYKYW